MLRDGRVISLAREREQKGKLNSPGGMVMTFTD
jgi:hypothetical protein